MAIKDWPTDERPREKLMAKGAEALSDAELLAIFLRTGCVGKSAIDLARDLIAHFGGLRPLLEADQDLFCRAQGLGVAKYCQLRAVLEIGKRHFLEIIRKDDTLDSPHAVRRYLTAQLRHREREVFAVLFLDNQNRLITYKELFTGTIDSAQVHPREIVKQALKLNSAALILAHNHPSGVAEPSQADIRITQRIKDALNLIDMRLLDHMIIGEDQVLSMAERGLL